MTSDLRFALRLLLKSPGFTTVAILTLGLAIGVNTSIFSLIDTLFFAPPSYKQPNEIVQLFSQDVKNPKTFRGFSYPTYRDIREQNTVFSGLLAHNFAMVGLGEKGDTRRVFADAVSSNYFSVLGTAPARGRAFLPEEETPGRGAAVTIVSHNYWKKTGFDPAVLGSKILINSRPFTVVGIMPEGFTGTTTVVSAEVWLPLGVYDQVANDYESDNRKSLGDRAGSQLLLIGRLKPGMTAAAALPALKTLATNLEKTYPVEQKNQTFTTTPLSRFSTSTNPQDDSLLAPIAPLLLGMAFIVLLVACLNLANMLLARGTARRKEIAIRQALGGARSRIVRQLLIEGFVLALGGGAMGIILGLWSSDLLIASLGRMVPLDLVWHGGPNPALLGATLAFCTLGTICFALGPALKLSRGLVIGDLKENAAEDVVRRHWKFLPRNPLVVAQIALSLALLTAATLFIRGAQKAARVETGLKTERTFLLEVDASLGGHDQKQSQALYQKLGERLTALPGVEEGSISSTMPFGMMSLGRKVQRAGIHPAPDTHAATAADGLAFEVHYNSVGADYFKTVGLHFLRGRAFTTAEADHGGPAVAIIDDVLAKKLWPNEDALGQRLQIVADNAPAKGGGSASFGMSDDSSGRLKPNESIEVVGIVPTTPDGFFEKEPEGHFYLPFARGFQSDVFFITKFAFLNHADETATADLVRRTVRELDPALPILSLKTFAQHLESNADLWLVRAGAALFSIFGGLALTLAAIGIYGVKAYAVARRRREIGIRMALGARPGAVQWMFIRETAVMLMSGVGLGLLFAVFTGRIVSGLLYEVGALDPIAFTVAPLVLAVAALLATWLPARRAARVDPMVALRAE
ncbi:MAG: ABC transporter permease [Chthoniobacterales bacterium]|nr:ABC transporter permease [Chthoniobacterales bacterium]